MNTGNKHFAFIYFMYRIVESYANRLSEHRNSNDNNSLYQRLNFFMYSYDETKLNKETCLALPLVFAINSSHKNELINFWQTLKPLPNKNIFIIEDLKHYLESNGNLFNKIFHFQMNTIFLNDDFHFYSHDENEIGVKELMKFLGLNDEDVDPTVYPICNLIDESIKQFADHEDFFTMVSRPDVYLAKFTKVKTVHKSAMQFFDSEGIFLGHYKSGAIKIIYEYICERFKGVVHEKKPALMLINN